MKQKGFTLFELLVSISIIGILVALVSLSYSSAQRKARDSRRIEDMKSIQSAAEQYYSLASFVYPASTSAPADWTYGTDVILDIFPTDPKGVGWTAYSCSGFPASYCCCAAMENSDNGNATDSSCTFAGSGNFYCVRSQQ